MYGQRQSCFRKKTVSVHLQDRRRWKLIRRSRVSWYVYVCIYVCRDMSMLVSCIFFYPYVARQMLFSFSSSFSSSSLPPHLSSATERTLERKMKPYKTLLGIMCIKTKTGEEKQNLSYRGKAMRLALVGRNRCAGNEESKNVEVYVFYRNGQWRACSFSFLFECPSLSLAGRLRLESKLTKRTERTRQEQPERRH